MNKTWPLLLLVVTMINVAAFSSSAHADRDKNHYRGDKHHAHKFDHRKHFRYDHRKRFRGIGTRIHTLPPAHRIIRARHYDYYYYGGSYYRPHRHGGYITVHAPLGARVGYLPPGYVSFFIGPRHYFYANFTYYLWDHHHREYIVVAEPDGAEGYVANAGENQDATLFVYPNAGQSDEQRERDRYECYMWAVEQTGFDPAQPEENSDMQRDYRRAISACLEGRDYTVK